MAYLISKRNYLFFFTLLCWFLCLINVSGQSINTEFGKNRVQYHDDFDNWWQYETQNFITYWYGKSRNVAFSTIQIAEKDHGEIQKLLEHRINDKIEIIVYLDISDLKQSNIGTEEAFVNKTGETKIIGNKMFVYFDGDHQKLRKKIREGIARVYFNHMLFGSTFQEIIQNALLMNIPEWFKSGITSYATSPWDYLIEDELRDIWLTKPTMRDFKKLSTLHPRLAGHSFWFFIEQNYGKSAISNILYLTKISRGVESSFLYVLNEDMKQIFHNWKLFYLDYFENENQSFENKPGTELQKLKKRPDVPVSQLQFNASGTLLAYIQNQKGRTKLKVKDLKTGKIIQSFKTGFVNDFQETDYGYPTFSWYPGEDRIAICYERRDVIRMRTITMGQKKYEEQILPDAIQRIYNLSIINENEFVFSGSVDGFSDLLKYKRKTRNIEKLTDDYFDDLDAVYGQFEGKQGILFSSNRLTEDNIKQVNDTIIPIGKFKTYFLSLDEENSRTLQLVHSEALNNIRFPIFMNEPGILYVSSSNGINNLKYKDPVEGKIHFVTNLDRNLIRYHAQGATNQIAFTYYHQGKYKIISRPFATIPSKDMGKTTLQQRANYLPVLLENEPTNDLGENTFIPDGFLFQSNFIDIEGPERRKPIVQKEKKREPQYVILDKISKTDDKSGIIINPSRIIPANKKFSLQKVTTKFDNDILFEGLESYTGDRQQLIGTPMGFLMKANIKDLFEDYSIDLGTRLPLLLNGSEFFLVFDNKKSLIDKKMALYRRSQAYNGNPENQPISVAPSRTNKITTLGLMQWKIPFNIYRSVRLTTQLRFDKYVRKSTDNVSYLSPLITEQRIGFRAEYIYDNIHEESVNIKFGTRYKVYAEAINLFNIKLVDGFEFDASKGFTTILGFDARHYIPVLRKSVLAIRGTGAVSLGSDRMLYYIGGMENWLFPKFQSDIPQREDLNFAYKANIGQMRGFQNNIRNGTSYLIANTELRIPFMQYILGRNKGSNFVRNMQLTGFFDMGLAWYGNSPYSKENPLNTVTLQSPPIITLEVEYFKDPAVFGLGFGFRTQVLGYFVKFDYAWGIETGAIQPPVYYFSFGQDF